MRTLRQLHHGGWTMDVKQKPSDARRLLSRAVDFLIFSQLPLVRRFSANEEDMLISWRASVAHFVHNQDYELGDDVRRLFESLSSKSTLDLPNHCAGRCRCPLGCCEWRTHGALRYRGRRMAQVFLVSLGAGSGKNAQ